jgi:diaminopimelate epimerase
MTNIKFTKMHGLGNDFILVEDADLPDNTDYAALSIRLCDRHFGIGADGLIIVNPKDAPSKTDTAWRILNNDGSEPEMCGNGIRCFAKYVHDKGLIRKDQFTVSTLAGIITPKIESNSLITVDMGEPVLEPSKIPVTLPGNNVVNTPVEAAGKTFNITCISMGNPHCVIFPCEPIDVKKYGPIFETHAIFPRKTNVEFVQILSKTHIKVDVWERGCGITLACGTGACACTVAGVLNELTERNLKVSLPGGDLFINYDVDTNHLFMTGPAKYAFEGVFIL